MAKKVGRKPHAPDAGAPMPLAMSIREFCRAHRLSEAMFFKLQNAGMAPRTMQVGRRKLISIESASEWRKAREEAATAAA
jgi:hypothetical protein